MFTHGVASGDPSGDGVVLWTRAFVADGVDVPLRWVVTADEDGVEVVASGEVTAAADHDHTARVVVTGLEPDRWWWYRFEPIDPADGSTTASPIGRTRTLPVGPVDRFRIGVVCCALYRGGWFNAYAGLAARDDVDLVLHLGDYVYEFGNPLPGYAPWCKVEERVMEPDHETFTLDDYRTRWNQARRDPDLLALHARFPIVHLWEDHEIVDDCWATGAPDQDDVPVPWVERKAAGVRAFWEWLPVRWPDRTLADQPPVGELAQHPVLYRSTAIGDLVDLIAIDTRHEGRTKLPKPLPDGSHDDPSRRMMSDEQQRWLEDQLAGSTATWRVVANPSMFTRLALRDVPEHLRVKKLSHPLGDGTVGHAGQWEGFAAHRAELAAWAHEHGRDDLVLVTGDIHSSWACEVRASEDDEPIGVELIAPSVSTRSLGEQVTERPTHAHELERLILAQNPWIRMVELTHHGFLHLDVQRDRLDATWWFVTTNHARVPPALATPARRAVVRRSGSGRGLDLDVRREVEPDELSALLHRIERCAQLLARGVLTRGEHEHEVAVAITNAIRAGGVRGTDEAVRYATDVAPGIEALLEGAVANGDLSREAADAAHAVVLGNVAEQLEVQAVYGRLARIRQLASEGDSSSATEAALTLLADMDGYDDRAEEDVVLALDQMGLEEAVVLGHDIVCDRRIRLRAAEYLLYDHALVAWSRALQRLADAGGPWADAARQRLDRAVDL